MDARAAASVEEDGARRVPLGGGGTPGAAGLPDNSVRSAKYTPVNLVPRALYEQFRRVANFYFLVVAAVSFIPGVSPTSPLANVSPLLVVVGFGFARDVYEDVLRARSDKKTNAALCIIMNRGGGGDAGGGGVGGGGKGYVRRAERLRRFNLVPEEHSIVRSRDISVGDVVVVFKGESIPADLVLLHSALEGGVAYVSTASLDGESNLKRLVVAGPCGDVARYSDLARLRGYVSAKAPTLSLYEFDGSMNAAVVPDDGAPLDGQPPAAAAPAPLDAGNLLLRGSILRNTDYVYGMAVYTGFETKVALNMRHPPSKMGNTEKKLNVVVLALFANLLVLVVVAAVLSGVLQGRSGAGQWYMGTFAEKTGSSVAIRGLATFLILFSTYIPVSLFVTLEFVRVVQGVFMQVDASMKTKGQAVSVKATNLNEVLGQIQFVLSDKTGTLTENIMRYIACSAGGVLYDTSKTKRVMEKAVAARVTPVTDLVLAMALCHNVVPEPKEADPEPEKSSDSKGKRGRRGRRSGKADSADDPAKKHDGVFEGKASVDDEDYVDELPEYQGQSPDEVALVTSAREYGVALLERTLDTMVISKFGTQESYQALAELEFNSDRKRMSMIFRCPDGVVRMFTKGADTIMMPLLKQTSDIEVAQEHIDTFAKDGLRTLVYASKTLGEAEFEAWYEQFLDARNLLDGRNEAVAEVSARLEVDLDYIAVTAVEDKLQDRVPETIKFLREAGVGLWVLTGDKRETAENIGYSANLLDRQMNVVHIEASSAEQLEGILDRTISTYASGGAGNPRLADVERVDTAFDSDADGSRRGAASATSPGSDGMRRRGSSMISDGLRKMSSALSPRRRRAREAELALIIDGRSLGYVLESHAQKFMDLAESCKTVICCRVTPLQKALVVRMVREMRQANTLAIGDGGNDVSMIQEAHVGVGLFGKEGTQAARAGDYAMSEFKHLQRLTAIHGRYAYVRTAGMINLSFYKNILFTLTQVFFQIFDFVTGTSFQDQWIVASFNVVVTAMSPFLYGVFERDLDESTLLRFPSVYSSNHDGKLFSLLTVLEYTMLYGLWHSVAVFFGTYWGLGYLSIPFRDGRDGGLYMTALGTALMIVIISLFKFAIHSHNLNWLVLLAIVLSFGIFFLVIPLSVSVLEEFPLEGVLGMLLGSTQFYITAAGAIVASFVVDFTVIMYRQLVKSNIVTTLQQWEKSNRKQARRESKAGLVDDSSSVN